MNDLLFLKLGGSLITDKTGVEVVREEVLARLAQEIRQARAEKPGLRLLMGHGSGSFGHVAGAKHGTRQGVATAVQWQGFAEVSSAADRLNKIVTTALVQAGVPAVSLQPAAALLCTDGQITHYYTAPIEAALNAGLVPVIYGDVAFDTVRGGTIVSTEEVMMALTDRLQPRWLLLAGETDGVYDLEKQTLPQITSANFEAIKPALGGSRGTDVTGGMVSKVQGMLDLVAQFPDLAIRIFSGLENGTLRQVLLTPHAPHGTEIKTA